MVIHPHPGGAAHNLKCSRANLIALAGNAIVWVKNTHVGRKQGAAIRSLVHKNDVKVCEEQ